MAAALSLPVAATEIAPEELATLPSAQVVVLGEVHDNPHHHASQARAVRAVAPRALVFEHLTPEQASRVVPDLIAEPEAMAWELEWEMSGWPDFTMFHPIFAAAPYAGFYGAGVPRPEASRAFEGGAAAAFGADAARFGLDLPLPPEEQAAQEAEQQEAHCNALPPEMLPAFVEAQRLRDAVLARETLRALEETGGPVVVITGNGHARRDRGLIPYLLAAAPEVTTLAIGQFEAPTDGDVPFDLWLVTPPAEREDPCLAFR